MRGCQITVYSARLGYSALAPISGNSDLFMNPTPAEFYFFSPSLFLSLFLRFDMELEKSRFVSFRFRSGPTSPRSK